MRTSEPILTEGWAGQGMPEQNSPKQSGPREQGASEKPSQAEEPKEAGQLNGRWCHGWDPGPERRQRVKAKEI